MSTPIFYIIFFAIISFALTIKVVRRMGRAGCMSYGYIGLVILCINSIAVASVFFIHTSLSDFFAVATSGETYTATVVSFTSERHYDSEDERYYMMYQPTVEFKTESGNIIKRELDFSSSDMEVGDTYKLNYNSKTDKVIPLGFTLILKLVGSVIFFTLFSLLSIGIALYGLGYNMSRYKDLVSKFATYFFIPFLMIGFNALLIYGIFYGNPVPWYVTLILVFFVLALSFAIVGYFKTMFFVDDKPEQLVPKRWIDRDKTRIDN